jgi:uncharacterized membrane protein
MTRIEFIDQLKKNLNGLPIVSINEIVADYEAHFADGASDGRTEAEVALALGDPERLARELKAEIGLKRWENQKTPSSAITAIFALLGLGALDILVLFPLLMGIAGALFGVFMVAISLFIGGGVVFAVGPFAGFPGGIGASLIGGLGLIAAGVTIAALLAIVTIWLINGIVWFARLHYRLLKPALEARTV